MNQTSVLFISILIALLVAISTAVYDGGYYRFNRVQRSDTLKKVDTFTLSTINSNHFTSLTSFQSQPLSTQPTQSWSELFTQLDVSQQHLFSSAQDVNSIHNIEHKFFSLASGGDHHLIPLSIPQDSHMSTKTNEFYIKLNLHSQWGGAWQSSSSNTPQGKALSHELEHIPFDHKSSSSFTLSLNEHEQLLFNIEWASNSFGRKYAPKVQSYNQTTGDFISQTIPTDHSPYCFFTAQIAGVVNSASATSIHSQEAQPIPRQFNLSTLTNNLSSPTSAFSTQSMNTNVQFFETTLSIPQFNTNQNQTFTSSQYDNGATLSTDFPEYGQKFSLNTCRGGYEGTFLYKGALYTILPLLNHISITEAAFIMSQLETQYQSDNTTNPSHTPDLNTIHIIFDATQPSYDFFTNYVKELKESGFNLQNDDDIMISMCGTGTHKHAADTSASPTTQSQSQSTKQKSKSSPYDEFKSRLTHDHGDEGQDNHNHDHSHQEQSTMDLFSLLSTTTDHLVTKYYEQQEQQRIANAYIFPTFSSQQSTSSTQRYIELLFVHDAARVANLGAPAALQHGATLALTINTFMSAHNKMPQPTLNYIFPVELVLVDQLAWTTDPYVQQATQCDACAPGEVSVDYLLQRFNSWRSTRSNPVPHHDNAHLLSGLDFQASVLGYAGVNTMCSLQSSSGIDQVMTSSNSDFSSIIIMHEMHHNLSSSHDGDKNTCPVGVNVMSPSLSTSATTGTFRQLSACSMDYVNRNLASYVCLTNVPEYVYGQPRCGNGIVEVGEECDCGSNCAVDSCCDGTTCKLYPTAMINGQTITPQCSLTQSCCDDMCQIRSKGFTCLTAVDACNLDEFCDGVSGNCPDNTPRGSGFECTSAASNNSLGKCYLGSCITEQNSCNTLGAAYVNCPSDQYIFNHESSQWCQNKQCLVSGSCGIMAQSGTSSEPLPWDDGIPCGPEDSGRQCYQGKCVDMNDNAVQFQWVYSPWDVCDVCGEPQTRSATCSDKINAVYPENEQLCSEPTAVKQSLIRACNTVQLGCVYDYSEAEKEEHKGKIYFFGVWASTVIVAMVFVGIILFWLIISLCCYRCITRPVDGVKDASEEELTEEQQNKLDDKIDAEEHKAEAKEKKKKKKQRAAGPDA